MDPIATLAGLRVTLLQKAEQCETVFAMRMHHDVALQINRVIDGLKSHRLSTAQRRNNYWAKIQLSSYVDRMERLEGLDQYLADIRDLGIQVLMPTKPAPSNSQRLKKSLAA